jgi:hypothetical protein
MIYKCNDCHHSIPEHNRKFQANWYSKFSWLEYEISRDAAFCFICKQYRTIENEKCAFKLTDFNDWHNAIKSFSVHENTESHKTNTIRLLNRIIIEKNGVKSCASQFEFINLISKQIIISNLPSKFYAIICDETMDLSRKEMLALCLRKVDYG